MNVLLIKLAKANQGYNLSLVKKEVSGIKHDLNDELYWFNF